MVWPFAVAGMAGLLLGLWFRVPALIAASVVTAVTCLTVATQVGLGFMFAAGLTFGLLAVLQVGYVVGLALSCARSRGHLLIAERDALTGAQGSRHPKVWARLGYSRKAKLS